MLLPEGVYLELLEASRVPDERLSLAHRDESVRLQLAYSSIKWNVHVLACRSVAVACCYVHVCSRSRLRAWLKRERLSTVDVATEAVFFWFGEWEAIAFLKMIM